MFKKTVVSFVLAAVGFGVTASSNAVETSVSSPDLPSSRSDYESRSTTLTVDIGAPTANEPGDNLYAEIQEAVDAASAGDKIRVHAGTYFPFVVNTDNLTIREANANSNPVIDGNLNPGDENGVEVNASGVTIRGLTVRNASGVSADGTGFLVTGGSNTLTGNTAIDNHRGFHVVSSNGNTLKGNFSGGNNSAYQIDGSDDNMLTDNVAIDNTFGFDLAISNDNTLTGNTAIDSEYFGYYNFSSERNTFERNFASGNGYNGFFLEFSDGNTLTGNTVSDNGIGFQLEFSDDNTLTGNRASENFHGFFNFSSDGNTFERNWAFDNVQWGFFIDEVLANMFQNNRCSGNGMGGSNQPGVCTSSKRPTNP